MTDSMFASTQYSLQVITEHLGILPSALHELPPGNNQPQQFFFFICCDNTYLVAAGCCNLIDTFTTACAVLSVVRVG